MNGSGVGGNPFATATEAALAQTQKAGEITRNMELIDKLTSEIHEEVVGLNGTFANVLRPGMPHGAETQPSAKPAGSGLGSALDKDVVRLREILGILRDVRSRCEL
jgi:hypothetical protein